MKVLINYANKTFRPQQKRNTKTGKEIGRFDKVISYSPNNIDPAFYRENEHILSQKRGNGYYLWKPYFIEKTLRQLSDGDFLFYCDSAAFFIETFDPLIEICKNTGQDIIPFEIPFVEKNWTKRDAFILMNCDSSEFSESKQRLAGFTLWRKSDFTMNFVAEYLKYGRDSRIITDSENVLGYDNYPGFIENRHDQSIFSLLSKQYGLEAFRDPSQWGNSHRDLYPNSNYNQILFLTRKKRVPLGKRISRKIEKLLSQL